MMDFIKLGGRRFVLALGSGIITSALVWFGKISDAVYGSVIVATVAAYITGGTWDNHQNTKAKDAGNN